MARVLKQRGAVSRGPVIGAALTIPVYAVLAIGATPHFPEDAALLAYTLAAAAAILWVLLRKRSDYHLLERLLLYVGVTTIVFYWGRVQAMPAWAHHIENIYFALLGFALVVAYRFTRNRAFTVTPTDFLIIFIALIVPTLSGSVFPDNRIGEVAIKVLILFYAVELIVSEVQPRLWLLRGVVTTVLLLLAVRVGWTF